MTDISVVEISTSASSSKRRGTPWARVLGLTIASIILLFIFIAALFPHLLTGYSPLETNTKAVHQGPSLEHLFGTDHSGRDVFARVIYGTGASLSIGFYAVMIAMFIGSMIGIISGFSPSWLDLVITRVTEIFMAFPEFLIALIVVAILGPGQRSITIGIAVGMIPAYVRLSRVVTQQMRLSDFLAQDRIMSVPLGVSLMKQVFPNVISRLFILAIIGFSTAITSGAALSFLGLGLKPPTPEWGVIMNEGKNQIHNAWWVTITAGLVLAVTVIAITAVARQLEKSLVAR